MNLVSEVQVYNNANQAFELLYDNIITNGIKHYNTKALYNCSFYILNPIDNEIKQEWRKWNKSYAELEWKWYLSGNPNPDMVAEKAKLWNKLRDKNGNVNSNYGYQWNRGNQLNYVIQTLKDDKESRRAVISLYDGKENSKYKKDTVCTLAINFFITSNKLNMNVLMRSQDLIWGFCNDQYCFSKLQELIANELSINIGLYYHFVTNLHIYERHFNMKNKYETPH